MLPQVDQAHDVQKVQDSLLPWIPPVLWRWPEFAEQAEHEVVSLFIDVAGFTPLSEALAAIGPEGAERLEGTIAAYLNALLEVLEPFGGYPIKVAGDSLAVIFPITSEGAPETLRRVLACASAFPEAVRTVSSVLLPDGPRALAHKVGIGVGRLLSGAVGDSRLRAEFVFAGRALEEAAAAEHHAVAGEIWVSPAAAASLQRDLLFDRVMEDGFARLCLPMATPPDLETPFRAMPLFQGVSEVPARYRSLIPFSVLEHASAGTLKYLCRHQHLTVMFAGCPSMVLDRVASLEVLDAHYRQTQQLVEQYGGFLSEFEAGDKGAKLVVLFGAPTPLEDPAGQAVRCARAMQEAARETGLIHDQRIGIASGRLYAGRIGCRSLVRYSALGDRMNLSARLMMAAPKWGVLAERQTFERASREVRWSPSRTIAVKGKQEPIEVRALRLLRQHPSSDRRGRGILGREPERRALRQQLASLLSEQRGTVTWLTGEPGMGKSRLLELIRREAVQKGLEAVWWQGAIGTVKAPLAAFRPLLLKVMDVSDRASPLERQSQFNAFAASLPPEIGRLLPLLSAEVGVEMEEDRAFASIPQERLQALRLQTLLDIIFEAVRKCPWLLIIDGAEWLDASSAQALRELVTRLTLGPLWVVVTSRPVQPDQEDPLDKVRKLHTGVSLELKPLSPEQVGRLASRRLRARRIDPELATFLTERAAGNPFAAETWVDFLRDHGHVRLLRDTAFLSSGRIGGDLPDRLEALLLTQLERLPPAAQVTLEVASIVGASFEPSEVAVLHPDELPEDLIQAHLKMAAKAGILWYDRNQAPRMFFSHTEYLNAVHERMPFVLRRQLHRRRADAIRLTGRGALSDDQLLQLARHYTYIDEPEEQLEWFFQAAVVSDERFDHRGTDQWTRQVHALSLKLKRPEAFLPLASRWSRALELLGEPVEQEQVLARWRDVATEVGDSSSLIEALRHGARALQRAGRPAEAIAALEQALPLASGAQEGLASDILNTMATLSGEDGHVRRQVELAKEALARVAQTDHLRLSNIRGNRGTALAQLGLAREARDDFVAALRSAEALGDVWRQSILLGNLAVILWETGRPEEGHERLIAALELKRRVGDRREEGMGLLNVGYSAFRLGDLESAERQTVEAMRRFERAVYPRGMLVALSNLLEIRWARDDLTNASHALKQAESLLSQSPNPLLRLELLLRRGELELSLGKKETASDTFRSVLEDYHASGPPEATCNALEGLAEASRQLLRLDDAHRFIEDACIRLESGIVSLTFPQRVWYRASVIALSAGHEALAAERLRQAREVLREQRNRLTSRVSRQRFMRAFSWNRAIAGAG